MPIINNSLCSQTGAAFNMPFGTKTTYDSQGNAPNTAFGNNWVSHDLGQLVFDGSNVMYVEGANQIEYFVSTGGGAFQFTFFVKSVLSQNTVTNVFTLISPDGSVKTFTSAGLLSGFSDAYGNQGTVSYITSAGQARVNLVQITSGADSIKYDYDWDNTTAQLTVLTYYVNNRAVQKTEQMYYTGGNLRKVVISHNTAPTGPTWAEVESRYYTYDDDNDGLLKHVLGPNAYKQMHDASPGGQNWPDTATSDTDFDQYADSKFAQYDGDKRVEQLYRHGGQYFYKFTYSISGFSGSNLNTWKSKVVATQPDGSEERLYYNLAGQLMLRQVVENPGGSEKVWNVLHQRFDNTTGRRVLAARADAIDHVNESNAFLVTLHPNLGLIRIYHFDTNGNHDFEAVQQGTSDTERKLWSRTFVRNTATGLPAANVYEVASETVYRNDNNTGGITTNYSYQWHPNGVTPTYQVLKRTTTLPAVPVGENGRNQVHTIIEDYNQWGLLTARTDERGVKTMYQWDLARGAIKQIIRDEGGGVKLNLTIDYVHDDFGRVLIEKGPLHQISLNGPPTDIRRAQWTYYKDVDDQLWTFGGYITIVSGVESVFQAVGPVTLQYNYQTPADTTNMKGWRQEAVVQAAFTSSGIPSASATFARSSWTRWSAQFFTKGGDEVVQRLYWNIPSSGDGTVNTHYGQTDFAYDSDGRLHRVKQPGGTLYKTTYNSMGWPLEKLVGTDDGSPANMKLLAVQEYDNGSEGVGNLTKTTVKVDDTPGNDRIAEYTADWRHRLLETKASVEKDGGTWVILERHAYDNRDNLISVTTYHTSVVNSNRIGYRTQGWDTRNRLYETRDFLVNLTNGTPGTSLYEKIYYDPSGNVARQIRPGSDAFEVRHYDAVSRVTASYVGYDSSSSSSSSSSGGVGPDPSSISTATIIEQQAFAYDEGSNLISITRKQRFDNATGVGALNSTIDQPKARASHFAYYPDALGRSQVVANFGTYQANTWNRNSFPTVPPRSDTVLVNSTTYDAAGDPTSTIDPQNVQTCRAFDKAGRLTSLVENCAASSGSSSSSSGSTPEYRVTHFQYTPDSLLSKLTLDNSATGQEVTEWFYGVLPSGTKPFTLASNRLVREKAFADSGGSTDRVFYQYNSLGELTVLTDQAATAHAYVLDKFGRLLSDTATLAGGSPLDNTVGKLSYGYEVRGHRSRATSYAPGGSTKVNEVTWEFNSFGQPSKEIQNTTPSVGGSSREFVYGYETGVNNSARRTSMTLPSGQVINYIYSSHDAFLSRVTQVRHASTTIASYRYLGLGVFVGVNDNVPAVALTYEHGSGGDAGDQYTGLDRFGRVVDLRWNKSGTALVSLQMGYSRASNVLWWRDNAAIAASKTDENQAFTYDLLYQLRQRRRGAMSGTTIPSPVQTETIGYDQVGNWLTYQIQPPSLSQTRTHNKGNEITAFTNHPAGVITPPTYDPTGNMTYLPQPAAWNAAYTLKWDVWNRLMKATPTAGVVQDYAYDALSRRVTKTISSTVRKFYYTDAWQVAEEYIGTASDPQRRYFWGARDINDLIRRQRYSSGTTLQDDLYALRDASLNVVALTDASGAVQQRARYAAFGKAEFLTSAWVDTSNTYDWNVLFHGHYFDGETGFGQMRYRYYHPTLGRWLNRDPIEEKGGINLYAMVGNKVLIRVDMLGLIDLKCRCCWLLVAAAGEALQRNTTEPGMGHDDPGGGNAFRHCYIACQVANQCGVKCAKDRKDGWDGREYKNGLSRADRIDLLNNKRGYDCASTGKNCLDCCLDKWRSGKLKNGPTPGRGVDIAPPPPPGVEQIIRDNNEWLNHPPGVPVPEANF
jgi:RHS repeat-associated protein